MRAADRRNLIGLAAVTAVLASAAGLAYLGAISYREDRGLVAQAVSEYRQITETAAARLDAETRAALDKAIDIVQSNQAPAVNKPFETLKTRVPLVAKPFRIGARGEPWLPGQLTLSRRVDPVLDLVESRPRPSAKRAALLYLARQAERGACTVESDDCQATAADLSRARRRYTHLEKGLDTGPDALLGLARIALRSGAPERARSHYRSLRDRFGQYRDRDGISFDLWADFAEAQLNPVPELLISTIEDIVNRRYAAPENFLTEVVRNLRSKLVKLDLSDSQRARLNKLADKLDSTGVSQAFYADLTSISRSATTEPRGQARQDRTFVYKRTPQRVVVGIELSPASFVSAAKRVSQRLLVGPRAQWGAHLTVHHLGRTSRLENKYRILASSSFGPILPNFEVSLVQPLRLADPLDKIIRTRSRRHLLFSGGLGLVLIFGLITTIRTTAKQRELAKLKSDFVSTVSHELKTPLTSIRMFGEMLQQRVAGDDRDREQRYQDIIVKESERLGLLIANLLDYAQIERGAQRYSLATWDLRELVSESVETFHRLNEDDDLFIEWSPPAGNKAAFLVEADREVLVQALLNLLGNAAKYGRNQPIKVSVEANRESIDVSVIDNGPGIADGEHKHIFEEFYRSPAARQSGVEGTGLGLALVRRHVRALGGTISVTNIQGSGARFTISLPPSGDL